IPCQLCRAAKQRRLANSRLAANEDRAALPLQLKRVEPMAQGFQLAASPVGALRFRLRWSFWASNANRPGESLDGYLPLVAEIDATCRRRGLDVAQQPISLSC